ncbi:alpha/beta fold hydrolase [Sphingorhabdus sp. Alg231-15]|uniref:alpha/beta fold hydrolase n=1 Tax=Sphingorhabdus sp. Alg231-15 TaxID=1922222 RepID=UPI000D5566E0
MKIDILMIFLLGTVIFGGWSVNADAMPAPAYEASKRLPLEICEIDNVDEPLLCGVHIVFENRETKSGRRIPIKIVVVPAREKPTTDSAWIEHQGGPRFSMVGSAHLFAKGGFLESFRQTRDIVLIDPRGLHQSGPLYCEALKVPRILERYYPPEKVSACREELAKRVDLKQYSTLNAIEDFEDIRRWLGYRKWDVGGWSYGSRFMLTYLHKYPESIRSISLIAPSILNFERPRDYAKFGQQAFDRLVEDCRNDEACNARFPDVAGDLQMVLAKLETQPEAVEFTDPHSGKVVTRQLSRDVFAESIWIALLRTSEARQLPFVLKHAANGNFAPFVDLAVPTSAPPSEPEGHYFSVVCPEETGRLDIGKAEESAKNTFVGTYIARDYMDACEAWDLPLNPSHPIKPKRFSVPALIVTGKQDPVTAPEYGETIAQHFENSVHVSIPHMAHSISQMNNAECFTQFLSEFVEAGNSENLNMDCPNSLRPPAFRLN